MNDFAHVILAYMIAKPLSVIVFIVLLVSFMFVVRKTSGLVILEIWFYII